MNKFSNVAKACLKAIQAIARFIVLIGMLIVSLLTILVGKLLAILVGIMPVILVVSLLAILVASIVGVWPLEILNDSIKTYLNKNKDIFAIITLFAGIGLFSFMLQRYAKDGKGEEQAKKIDIWKFLSAIKNNIANDFQVLGWWPGQKTLSDTWKAMIEFLLYSWHFSRRLAVWLFLLFAILATFRATLFLLYPLPKIMIPEEYIVSDPVPTIILIITVTVVVCLFSFLIQKKLKENKSNTKDEKQKDSFWFLLPLVILILATLPMPLHFFPLFKDLAENIYKNWNPEQKIIITIFSLCSAIGLFYFLLQKYAKDFWKSLLNISEKISTAFRSPWLSGTNTAEKVQLKETLQNSLMLVFALWIGYILFFLGYLPIRDFNDWRGDVISQLGDVKGQLTDIKKDTANLMILRSSGYSPAFLSSNKDTFLLVYPPQGNLINKKGICPADNSQNLEWLKFFKKVFTECSKDTIKLRIQGFASAAPVTVSGVIDTTSDSLNCEIANQRAEALIHFLMLPPDSIYTEKKCKDVLDNSSIWKHAESDSTWKVPDSDVTVIYEPWTSPAMMKEAKPVRDSLRLDLEFLNRSVQIIIEEGGCLEEKVPASQQAMDNAENTN